MIRGIHTASMSRIARSARIAVVVTASCLSLAVTGPASVVAGAVDPPDTPAGRCAAAYFRAFNSGSSEAMQTFLEEYRAAAYLERHPLSERLERYERLRGIFGQVSALRIVLSMDLQLTLLADATNTGGVLAMRFQLEDQPPHRLAFQTISGIDSAEVTDEYVDYVASRAMPIDDALRQSTVRSVAQVLRTAYVYPALGQEMSDALLRNLEEGRYAEADKAGRLADMLTEDAVAVSKDRHVWVEAQNPMVQESSDPLNRPVEELRRENYHFRRVEVLPGNIGYIKFDMIHDDREAQEVAAAALAFVARCSALILDIRDNIGGEWGTAGVILGYLVPGGTVFSHIYDRDGRRVEERSTPESIPGQLFDKGVPVYVLTSSRTGSAAEAFAYALKHLGRATIVGEVTAGMAHPSEEVVVNDYFRVSVAFRRSENVTTGTSWEGTGVIPQIEVAADKALEAALDDALHR